MEFRSGQEVMFDDSQEESTDEDEEEEEDAAVTVHMAKSREDDEDRDFMTAFDSMLTENLHNRIQENVQVGQADISVPANVKSKIGLKTTRFGKG